MHASSPITFQLIRNATIKLDYAGTTFLVDPMLAPQGAYPGFPGTYNSHLRNPLVDLPIPLGEVIDADTVIVTHIHPDHWDPAASACLPKDRPVLVQDEADGAAIRKEGFTNVRVLDTDTEHRGIRLSKTAGQHGTDAMMASPAGAILGATTGIVFAHPDHPTVYVAGDTIWTAEIEAAIVRHRPDVIVLNTGYARLLGMDGAIIMGKEDLARASKLAPRATVIGIHMEAVNHAMQGRAELRAYIAEQHLDPQRVLVPDDGEILRF